MKKIKNIFSRLNLFLFLSSFFLLVFTLQNANNEQVNFSHHVQYSKTAHGVDTNSQQLSENSEFENDDDFEIAYITTPFLNCVEQFEFYTTKTFEFPFLSETSHQAIYLAIRNLRI